jgi:hypothetical protein
MDQSAKKYQACSRTREEMFAGKFMRVKCDIPAGISLFFDGTLEGVYLKLSEAV